MLPLMRSSLSRIFGLVTVAVCMIPCPSQAADKWLSIRSKNFLLVGNAGESSIRRVARELEELLRPRVRQFGLEIASVGIRDVIFRAR